MSTATGASSAALLGPSSHTYISGGGACRKENWPAAAGGSSQGRRSVLQNGPPAAKASSQQQQSRSTQLFLDLGQVRLGYCWRHAARRNTAAACRMAPLRVCLCSATLVPVAAAFVAWFTPRGTRRMRSCTRHTTKAQCRGSSSRWVAATGPRPPPAVVACAHEAGVAAAAAALAGKCHALLGTHVALWGGRKVAWRHSACCHSSSQAEGVPSKPADGMHSENAPCVCRAGLRSGCCSQRWHRGGC